jgi:hypothetical protein
MERVINEWVWPPKEPSGEECSNNVTTYFDGGYVVAAWYPQMGGHCGKCLISYSDHYDEEGKYADCFDIYIWHDGEFPFTGEGEEGKQPIIMHHCSAEQFIDFGNILIKNLGKMR